MQDHTEYERRMIAMTIANMVMNIGILVGNLINAYFILSHW